MVSPTTVAKRFALWTLICTVSAAPSFFYGGAVNASRVGMAIGVGIFILLYTAATATDRFERLYRRPFMRSTMYFGYGVRLILSFGFALALIGGPSPLRVLGLLDIWSGFATVSAANAVFGDNQDFPATVQGALLLTFVQGALLNIVVFFSMLLAYGAQRLTRKWPDELGPRGFDVVPVAEVRPPTQP